MHFNVANRKLHHWASFAAALPLVVIIASGILLQLKKHWAFVQPAEHRGSVTEPAVDLGQVLKSVRTVPGLEHTAWSDVDRVDVRPGRGLAKVTLKSRWEAQVDLGTGRILQTAYRRSDLIESIHDGSFFAGDWTKLGLFLPAGAVLLVLWLSGIWMVWVRFIGKRRRKAQLQRKTGSGLIALVLAGVSVGAQPQPKLEVEPIVGHWETVLESGESVVIADARKWKTESAATPFPLAAIRGVGDFTGGVLSVKFKMIAGESDQIAGIAFGITPSADYYYARYNTKDGNLALWRFEAGERRRLLDGSEHLQLPLNAWHDLRVEIRGTAVTVSANDKLRIEHTLPLPPSGRVGLYTKRDSVTAFKAFDIRR